MHAWVMVGWDVCWWHGWMDDARPGMKINPTGMNIRRMRISSGQEGGSAMRTRMQRGSPHRHEVSMNGSGRALPGHNCSAKIQAYQMLGLNRTCQICVEKSPIDYHVTAWSRLCRLFIPDPSINASETLKISIYALISHTADLTSEMYITSLLPAMDVNLRKDSFPRVQKSESCQL